MATNSQVLRSCIGYSFFPFTQRQGKLMLGIQMVLGAIYGLITMVTICIITPLFFAGVFFFFRDLFFRSF